ncbi:acyltransferase family protein [Agromyces salentinus]|uniref:Acyltransferase n=1 Tax=Agromyces salentinus TaxID=269421 RepID=A0ABN2MWP3_9MICO|nr:acyltransferase [Agromyces salentinus]
MEGFRAIAATGVLVGHVRAHMAPDFSWGAGAPIIGLLLNGLTLFFSLSGFLLFRPFAFALVTGSGFPRIGRYAGNRALRIFPVYIVITALVSLVLGLAYRTPYLETTREAADLVGYMWDPALLLLNFSMLQTFFPFSIKTGIGVAWSLSVELVFYVAMPLLAAGAMYLRRRKRLGGVLSALIPVAAIFAIGLGGKVVRHLVFRELPMGNEFVNAWGGTWTAVLARAFPVHADLFAFGMLAAAVVAVFEAERLPQQRAALIRKLALLVALLAAVASIYGPVAFRSTLMAVVFGGVILFVALPARTGRAGVTAALLDALPLRFVGLVSYSLYLWHVPVIWMVVRLGWAGPATPAGFVWDVAVVFSIALALSTCTYFAIERPALALKRLTGRRKPQTDLQLPPANGVR